jgi:hypothetical protein
MYVLCMCVCMYVCVYVCVCMYVCMYVCMCAWACLWRGRIRVASSTAICDYVKLIKRPKTTIRINTKIRNSNYPRNGYN